MRCLLYTLIYLSIAASTASAEEKFKGATRVSVERLLAKYGNNASPGCAVGVLFNKTVVFEGAAGTMDGVKPLTSTTPIYLASVSKQFTAAAVYRLAEQGKIKLDEPIRVKIQEVQSGGTIQQLLNHTSGLRDYSALLEVAGRPAIIENSGVIKLLSAQHDLNFEPGTDYEYSNSDYVLLAILVWRF